MKFSDKLVKLLSQTGKSQSKLARETGIGQSAISDLTLGKRRPYMDQAFILAQALGVSLDFLADDSADEPAVPATSPDEQAVLLTYRASGLSPERAIKALIVAAGATSGDRVTVANPPPSESDRRPKTG